VRTLIYFFMVLAVVGFLSLLTVHIAAFAGVTPPSVILKFVFVGLFVVWLPTVFVSNRLSKEYKQNDFWRATLRGCPKWMRTALWGIWGYGSLGTFLLPLLSGRNVDSYASSLQGMTGFVLIFYATAVGVLYSATRVKEFDGNRHCPNGHHVSQVAKFCEECGSPITDYSNMVQLR
jgi:hypothetical protein